MDGLFGHVEFDGHESVCFAHDRESGLRAIIAVHDTSLGPSLGGCRVWSYGSEAEALRDALRLSRGMSYKSALAGLRLGGGKSVILIAPDRPKTPMMMRAFGRAVERLGGAYVAAEDVGSSPEDMDQVGVETSYVVGRSDGEGDPSPSTARGVFLCLEAAARQALERGPRGLRVAVKGLGHVGMALCGRLAQAGATLTVADIDAARVARAVAEYGAQAAPVERIHAAPADVFAPCALGGDLNEAAIGELGARIVCGAANNQLDTPADDARLARRGVVYCPDYLVNAGGVIWVGRRFAGLDAEAVESKIAALPQTLAAVLARAAREDRPTGEVADAVALARLRPARGKETVA